jgi:modulator of FtsH protease HflK
MERVLGRTDKLILDQKSGAVPYLPLERTRPNSGKTEGGQ